MRLIGNTIHALTIACFMIHPFWLVAQDPYHYLDAVRNRFEQITDYRADMEIEVDVDFIRMPVKKATFFFKQPDKVRYTSNEFIMLPKVGVDFAVNKILNTPYKAIFNNVDPDAPDLVIIQVLPNDKNEDIILATVWVDTLAVRIVRMEIFTRKEGNFTVAMSYDNPLVLPSLLTVSFEIDQLNIPVKFVGNAVEIDKDMMKGSEGSTGKVHIRFSNYQVNAGIPDGFFDR